MDLESKSIRLESNEFILICPSSSSYRVLVTSAHTSYKCRTNSLHSLNWVLYIYIDLTIVVPIYTFIWKVYIKQFLNKSKIGRPTAWGLGCFKLLLEYSYCFILSCFELNNSFNQTIGISFYFFQDFTIIESNKLNYKELYTC